MKKRFLMCTLCLLMLYALAGCCIIHQWTAVTCDTPKTCLECGKTKGEPIGHSWIQATCTQPQTCTTCGATKGDTLPHNWQDATCTQPMTCTLCGEQKDGPTEHTWVFNTCDVPNICSQCAETSGEPQEHYWLPATCVEPETCYYCGATRGDPQTDNHLWNPATADAPMTCEYCGTTTGEPIPDHRFELEACKCVFGPWKATVSIPTSLFQHDTLPHALHDVVQKQQTLECEVKINIFVNAKMNMEITPVNWKKYSPQSQPDVLQYDFGVYYVEDGTLYIGMDWDQEMTPLVFTLDEEGTTLTLEGNILGPTKDDSYRKERFHQAAENMFYSSFKKDADLGTMTFERSDDWD